MLAPEVPMSHSVAGEPSSAGRRAAPLTTAAYSAAEWDLLTGLPGRVLVAAAEPAPGGPPRGVAAGLAGLDAVAAGRASDSDLVRAVVAAIYARHDGAAAEDRLTDLVDVLAACRATVRVLRRRADPADSAAYRQWVQSVAARVRRATAGAPAGGAVTPADRRFLDRLGGALDLG
ncbi:hypothetical protein [Micromonospora sp. WMMD712]|uniref:hypothetical protein n=1 Tax=Micromonospora sp. WMMD712 TaxID=3016096 RepID=UPI00249A9459|nr:hypothetical protein [Micromonospora sp. WMMD712]WFE59755.1 hypothetical protein O7633_24155 [Micromonospora sp. WMMD712]